MGQAPAYERELVQRFLKSTSKLIFASVLIHFGIMFFAVQHLPFRGRKSMDVCFCGNPVRRPDSFDLVR
jgi:hypothetical protein